MGFPNPFSGVGDFISDAVDTITDTVANVFVSQRETFFNLNIQRVVEDDKIQNTTKEATTKAILDEKRDIATEITKSHLNGPLRDFEKFNEKIPTDTLFPDINFSTNKQEAQQLPDSRSKIFTDRVHFDEVINQIESEENTKVIVDYYRYSGLNVNHLTKQILQDQFDWNRDTNVIGSKTQEKGTDVLIDAVRYRVSTQLLPENSRFTNSILGRPFSRFQKSNPTTTRIGDGGPGVNSNNQQNTGPEATPEQKTVRKNEPVFFRDRDNFTWVAQGIIPINTDQPIYNAEIGFTWLTVDNRGNVREEILNGDTFNIDLTADPNFIKDRDTIMVKYHYFDNDNNKVTKFWTYVPGRGIYPDIDNVKVRSQDIFNNRFPLIKFRENGERVKDSNSETKLEIQKYLADTIGFNYDQLDESIHDTENINEVNNVFMGMAVNLNSSNPAEIEYLFRYFKRISNDIEIIPELEKAQIDERLPQKSIWTGIGGANHQLSFNSVEIKNKSGNEEEKGTYTNKTEEVTRILPLMKEDGSLGTGEFTFKVKVFRFQKTDSVFEEVRVLNPAIQWEFEEADAGDVPLTGPDNEQALVFVDEAVSDEMDVQSRETLYFRSLHLIFASSKEVDPKWYQTGIFQFALLVVTVAVTYFTAGGATSFVSSAFASFGIVGAALAIIGIIALGFVLDLAFEQIVNVIGGDLGRIIAGVAAVASFAYAYGAGGFSESFNSRVLLSASSNLVDASNTQTQEDIQEIQEDQEQFIEDRKEKLEKLRSAETLLDTNTIVDPGFFRRRKPASLDSETPDQFFQRTIHSGNIGTLGFDAMHDYTEMMLKLPTIDSNPIDTIQV